MPSRLPSPIGSVRIEKHSHYDRSPYLCAEVRVTFRREEDGAQFELSSNDYKVNKRAEMTHAWLKAKVADMLAGRKDLDGLMLRSVEVHAVESVWSTPFRDLYPEDQEDAS